jgi:uncharacterized metal-binding protein
MFKVKHGYQVHDLGGAICAIGMSLMGISIGKYDLVLMGFMVMFDTLMLSPDLDLAPKCQPSNRWEIFYLGWLWSWYGKAFKHRSVWSHCPGIASTIKFVYLVGIVLLLSYAIGEDFSMDASGVAVTFGDGHVIVGSGFFIKAYVSLIISDLVHLYVDVMTTFKNQRKLFKFY